MPASVNLPQLEVPAATDYPAANLTWGLPHSIGCLRFHESLVLGEFSN